LRFALHELWGQHQLSFEINLAAIAAEK